MSRPRSSRRPSRGERGGVSWVSLLLFVLVAGGAYLTWVWAPLYFDNYAVRQVVADYMNQAIKNPDDAQLRRDMVQKLESLRLIEGVDQGGRPMKAPAITVSERDVTWERDQTTRSLRVAFDYERQVVYPFVDRVAVKVFSVEQSNDLTPPNWGPSR
jgi:hypothetical protein